MSASTYLHNATKVESTLVPRGTVDGVSHSYVTISIKDDGGNAVALFTVSPEAMFALTAAAAEAGTFLLKEEQAARAVTA